MNKKVALSLLSATVFASMTASAFAAPKSGVYMGGDVDRYYALTDLFKLNDAGYAKFQSDLAKTKFENLIFVDRDGKGASLKEILSSTQDFEKIKRDLKQNDFEGEYAKSNLDGTNGESYDPRKDITPEPTGDLKVESVSAINAKQIQVVFSKAVDKDTIIEDKGTSSKLDDEVKAGTVYVDGTAVTWKASLSEDGKTLTMQPAGGTGGVVTSGTTFKIEINQKGATNFVKDTEGNKAAEYLGTVKVVDTDRATLDKTDKLDPDTVRVYFSEPVQHPGTDLTATYADGSVATISLKKAAPTGAAVNYVDLDISGATPGKDATVTFTQIKDYAGNVSKPISVTVKKDVDEVKPVVQTVTPTSVNTFVIKASKAIKSVDVKKIKVNGTALGLETETTPTSVKALAVIGKDKSVVTIVLGDKQVGSVPVEVGEGALEDFAATPNKNDVFKTILNFNLDKTAPQVTSTKVTNDGTDNYLVVNFDEEIALTGTAGAAPSDLVFKYVDKMGVEQSVTVPAANVNVDASGEALKIKLHDNATTPAALPTNYDYKVELPSGYVQDNFENKFVKKVVTFTLGTTSSKLELQTGTPIAEKSGYPGVIEVKFAKAVDIASATNAANYAVEDAQVDKVKLVSNSETTGAVVEVYLKNNTVKLSGNYNVTVKGVKGYKDTITEMNSVTKNISLNENVLPTVKTVSIDKFDASTSATTITLTFSEDVKNATTATNDFTLFVDGKEATTATVTVAQETTGSKTLVVTIGKDLSADVTAGKAIKLVAQDSLDIKDLAGNVMAADDIVIK
ncbi:hypothetical protein RI662_09145 [Brevibacillus agri]|uniref:hypothetical protein n=1 Tax=Brevibacillus agri TaxID=51101 RepID=UPI0028709E53|nr:hypothetical protein [Brevibacillus agri]MDR9504466.1 hypothetical protein [Brevibacillus agri]